MCVSSARERSFEDRFAWLIRGEVRKKPIQQNNMVLPARDASSFCLKKKTGLMMSACVAPQDPWLASGSQSPFSDRPGRLLFASQIGAIFEIHEFINWGWHKWCPRDSPRKTWFWKKKYTNHVQFIKEILATSALGNEFGLTHKWWFYVDQTHVWNYNVRFVCTRA